MSRGAAGSVRTRRVRAAAALLTAVTGLVVAAGPAAATGYRYWSFWERHGSTWVYAQAGPATTVPPDGAVEGWRFAVGSDTTDAVRPRGATDFGAICAGTAPRPGTKRIALVLDFGTPADAPGGESPPQARTTCARIPSDASAAETLAAVAEPLRYDTSGLLCAIGGYPASGCGEQVTDPTPAASAPSAPSASSSSSASSASSASATTAAATARPSGSGGPAIGLLAGVAAVLGLGGAAWWRARARRSA